jgi:2-polyprenyl-3-methyl-5-hydroxy-6-metoxy-1,4-benzoquinol methylase
MAKFNYENTQYLDKLNELKLSYYSKYVVFIKKYLKNKHSSFLDVGCGNGVVLKIFKDEGYDDGYGVDISKLFINDGKRKGLKNLYYYNGSKLPFKDNFFDLVGSFNVLEHTKEPEEFLKDEILKLKKGGILIVACPNFMSVLFPSYHRRLKGIKNKLHNLTLIINKLLTKSSEFERMAPLIRKNFQYDDDAIVVTNLIDLKRIVAGNGCSILYESGFINYDTLLFKMVNSIPLLKYLLPSCFIVAKKK